MQSEGSYGNKTQRCVAIDERILIGPTTNQQAQWLTHDVTAAQSRLRQNQKRRSLIRGKSSIWLSLRELSRIKYSGWNCQWGKKTKPTNEKDEDDNKEEVEEEEEEKEEEEKNQEEEEVETKRGQWRG